MKIRVFDIKYDTDGEDVDLPQSIEFEVQDHEHLEDELSELISDHTGFCHFGFNYEEI